MKKKTNGENQRLSHSVLDLKSPLTNVLDFFTEISTLDHNAVTDETPPVIREYEYGC